jgi:hypothetical protein
MRNEFAFGGARGAQRAPFVSPREPSRFWRGEELDLAGVAFLEGDGHGQRPLSGQRVIPGVGLEIAIVLFRNRAGDHRRARRAEDISDVVFAAAENRVAENGE